MASTEIRRTTGSTPTNAEKFTVSLWFKLCQVGLSVGLFGWRENSNSGNNNLFIRINGNGNFQIYFTSNNGNDNHLTLLTNRVFRDCNSWYHAVISVDSSQSTSSDRAKLYINGIQETSFSSASYPASGRTFFSNDTQINFGKTRSTGDADTYFSGIQSHIHFTDGYAYDATAFGETDATTGEWKIKTSPSVTYGNNGFWWLKDSIATTDHSPNSNSWSSGGGTLTKTEDCPSNVFATMNPLVTYGTNQNALSEGNNTTTGIAYHRPSPPTLAASKGKWYFEAKALSGTAAKWWIGLCDADYDTKNQGSVGSTSNYIWGYDATTNAVNQRSQAIYDVNLRDGGGNISISNIFSAPSANDIYAMAVDLDNQKVWYAKNGVWNNGSASQSTTFNASYPDSTNIDANRFYYIGVGSENSKWSVNYGNGYFGTTAVSSAGTNASGIGIFEYDVPTGYTALSTKGLNL